VPPLGAAQPVRYVAEEQAGCNQCNGKGAEGKPDRTPSAFGGEQRAEGEDGAEADATESRTERGNPDCTAHLHE